jgi:hypothetical protein
LQIVIPQEAVALVLSAVEQGGQFSINAKAQRRQDAKKRLSNQ